MLRQVFLAAGMVLRPAGLVIIPLLMWAANGEWPSALLMAFLLSVSSRPVVAGQLGVTLLWMGLHADDRLAVALVGGSGPAFFSALQGAVFLVALLARRPLTRGEEQNAPNWAARFAPWFSRGLAAASVVFFAASLFRSLTPFYSGWACIAALYAWRMRDRSVPERTRFARALGSLLLVLLSTALGGALLEAGARTLLSEPAKPSETYMPDKEAIFTLRPESVHSQTIKGNVGEILRVDMTVSKQGIRDREYGPKTPGDYRIVMIGDSYTMGHGLPVEAMISRRMNELLASENPPLRVEVINCGVGGYAPWQERLFLRERGFPLEPDLVIVQLFPANDVAGSYSKVKKRLEAFEEQWERRLQEYRSKHELPIRAERWVQTHSNAYSLFVEGLKSDGPVRDLIADCRFFVPLRHDPIVISTLRNSYQEVCLKDWYPGLEEAWGIFADSVRGIRDDCRARGVDVAAYVHGDMISLLPDAWLQLNELFPETPYEMNKDIRKANELLDTLEIPRANVFEALREHPVPQEVYYIHDGHFTPLGAKIVAECLAQFVQERFLREK